MRRAQYYGEANEEIDITGTGAPEEAEHPYLDRLWSYPLIYSNSDNPFIQEISFFGLYQIESYAIDSSAGSASQLETRRARLGLRTIFFENFTLAGNFNIKTDGVSNNSIDVNALDTFTLAWRPTDNFQIRIGKQKAGFSDEYNTSSSRILTLERSLLVDQLSPSKSPGASLEMKMDKWTYLIGGYSGNTFTESYDNPFALARLGYNMSEKLNVEKANFRFYYLHNSTANSKNASPYRNSYSLSMDLQEGRTSNLTQIFYAEGYDEVGDAWGLSLTPAWFIYSDKLQVVLRYQYASSSNIDGLRLQRHYERETPDFSSSEFGNRYQAGYLGLNWYIYGNKLKVMTGIEYADMVGGSESENFSGWTWYSGLRLYF
ncbi:MAG: porin [Verrucomicrobiota bacterium]